MPDLADVLTRIQQVPLGALVDELRALHASRGSSGGAPETQPVSTAAATLPPAPPRVAAAAAAPIPSTTATDPLAPLLELLQRASSATLAAPTSRAVAASERSSLSSPGRRYESLQRHFGEHETELRRHARLTDRIIAQLARGELATGAAEPAPLQQEIRVLCTAGATSAARFLLCNELGYDALVMLEPRALRDAALLDGLVVACEPAQVELTAGAEIAARVRVDLARCPSSYAGRTLELLIDARVDGQVVQKIWVELVVRAAPLVEDETIEEVEP